MRHKVQCYIGYDAKEDKAYRVAKESIRKRCSTPLSIIPLRLKHLEGILTRPIEHKNGQLWCPISEAPMSTEFAISRFCVPFLQREGWALFADCDIICWEDINELFALADDKYAVMVVKHKHEWVAGRPQDAVKMDGQMQTFYDRKNWSSVVLWNCDHPGNRRFTRDNLNTWPGRDLHAFKWLTDSEIGELPKEWNWLINVTPGEPEKKGIWHFSLGLPIFANWKEAKYDEVWMAEYQSS